MVDRDTKYSTLPRTGKACTIGRLAAEGLVQLQNPPEGPAKLILQVMWCSFDGAIRQPILFVPLYSISSQILVAFLQALFLTIDLESNGEVETLLVASDCSSHAKGVHGHLPGTTGTVYLLRSQTEFFEIAFMFDRSHLIKDYRNYLSNSTPKDPLLYGKREAGRPVDPTPIHWLLLWDLYKDYKSNIRLTSAHVYLTNRTKMRTSLATFLFKPLLLHEVQQIDKFANLIPYLCVGARIYSALSSTMAITSIEDIQDMSDALNTLQDWKRNLPTGFKGRTIPTGFYNCLQITYFGLKWLIPKLASEGVSLILKHVCTDSVENWFSRARAYNGLNSSFTVLDYHTNYVRLQAMTNGGERNRNTSYEQNSVFDLDLGSLDLLKGGFDTSEDFFLRMQTSGVDKPQFSGIHRPRHASLERDNDAVVSRYIRVAGWLLYKALRNPDFSQVSDYLDTLIIKRQYDRITPIYGMLLWFKKVDVTVRQQIEAENWYSTWKGNFFFVLEHAMSSDNIFVSDFRDLLRSMTGPSSTGFKLPWRVAKEVIPKMAVFMLRKLAKSMLKDILIENNDQKRSGGNQAFRSQVDNPTPKKQTFVKTTSFNTDRLASQAPVSIATAISDNSSPWKLPSTFKYPTNPFN